MLRVEARQLEGELDSLRREEDVRAVVEDFNRRVREARRQLLGGPPVVTRTRDVDEEIAGWRRRRAARDGETRRDSEADAGGREAESDAGEEPTVPRRRRRFGFRRG